MSLLRATGHHLRRATCPHVGSLARRTISHDVNDKGPTGSRSEHDTQPTAEHLAQTPTAQASNAGSANTDKTADNAEEHKPARKMTVAEQDAALMEKWKERQGSLANSEFEGGEVEGGYRRNVKANIFRYI